MILAKTMLETVLSLAGLAAYSNRGMSVDIGLASWMRALSRCR